MVDRNELWGPAMTVKGTFFPTEGYKSNGEHGDKVWEMTNPMVG